MEDGLEWQFRTTLQNKRWFSHGSILPWTTEWGRVVVPLFGMGVPLKWASAMNRTADPGSKLDLAHSSAERLLMWKSCLVSVERHARSGLERQLNDPALLR